MSRNTGEGWAKAKAIEALREAGWKVFAHEDKYTPGVPDISASIDGHTAWLEAKVVAYEELGYPGDILIHYPFEWDVSINFKPKFGDHAKGHFRMHQLHSLLELSEKAWFAEYVILCANRKGGGLLVGEVSPETVLYSYREDRPVIVPVTRGADNWIAKLRAR